MILRNSLFVSVLILLFTISVEADIRLPALISNGMILQRNSEVKIWGWTDKNEKIQVQFLNTVYRTKSNRKGKWEVELNDLAAGGPYNMIITGSETIVIKDILIGDVWVCSGQSNMNYRINNAKYIYQKEIASSTNHEIRQFKVEEIPNFQGPKADYNKGKWVPADPETVLDFSAVAYFFADELYKKYKVPIGLIHASLSGSPAQAWISKKAIKEFPHYYEEAVRFKDSRLIEKIKSEEQERSDIWFNKANQDDEGYKQSPTWFDPNNDISGWHTLKLPGFWDDLSEQRTNGVVWLRKDIEVPAYLADKSVHLKLGRIVNADSVYVNGIFMGNTGHQWARRNYTVPEGILKEGLNTIVIRIVNHNGKGGFISGYPLRIEHKNDFVDISGEWKFRRGVLMDDLPRSTVFNWKSTGLFNGMIAPLTNYTIRGVIWYQGEGNTGKPKEYASLFPCMINDWRNHWGQGDFPFLFVQLANFMEPVDQPGTSNWAMLRDAQRKTLALSNTGMAVAIDIGEENDVHPINKKEVGYRLALEAQRVAYGDKEIISAGPLFSDMEIAGDKIILSFTTFGSKLKIKNNLKLQYFSIAGSDKRFVWAEAEINGDKIVVWNPEIKDPVAVRYAWANNPITANLVNSEGLPASPFRTDEWDK